jgi:hypothetical protein
MDLKIQLGMLKSVYSLREIFDLADLNDLNSVFTELSKRIN